MKVLALVLLAVAAVSSSGSGPYLPSGWKPQGPAFYLPSEVQKPSDNPLKDTILNESEASGSDALREYGPPKVVEVSQDLTRQALPETVTEQAFAVIEAKFIEEVNGKEEVVEVKTVEEIKAEEVTEAVEVTTEQKFVEETGAEIIEERTVEVEHDAPQGRAINVQAIEETIVIQDATESVASTTEAAEVTEAVVSTEAVVDSNVESSQVEVSKAQVQESQAEVRLTDVSQAEVSQAKVSQAEVSQAKVSKAEASEAEVSQSEVSQSEVSQAEVAEVRTAVGGVQNVVEALTNLEKEIKAQQIQSNEEAVEVKSVQILDSTEQGPEGFLEYGPPGFREYGPPQADELVRSAVVQEPTVEEQKIESNETRRRRFSPKFRPSKKH